MPKRVLVEYDRPREQYIRIDDDVDVLVARLEHSGTTKTESNDCQNESLPPSSDVLECAASECRALHPHPDAADRAGHCSRADPLRRRPRPHRRHRCPHPGRGWRPRGFHCRRLRPVVATDGPGAPRPEVDHLFGNITDIPREDIIRAMANATRNDACPVRPHPRRVRLHCWPSRRARRTRIVDRIVTPVTDDRRGNRALIRWAYRRLLEHYGRPTWEATYAPVDELIGTILS